MTQYEQFLGVCRQRHFLWRASHIYFYGLFHRWYKSLLRILFNWTKLLRMQNAIEKIKKIKKIWFCIANPAAILLFHLLCQQLMLGFKFHMATIDKLFHLWLKHESPSSYKLQFDYYKLNNFINGLWACWIVNTRDWSLALVTILRPCFHKHWLKIVKCLVNIYSYNLKDKIFNNFYLITQMAF